MNFNNQYAVDLCKSHSARSEKEFCRVCPSKLNKKELENVYFTLLENNLDLKTTINSQREQIKVLSTKVQRLTTLQKTYLGREPKECCGSKAIINEQKECISELRRTNECLSERVRRLNTRLCSAKQFLRRSPLQSTTRCNRCANKNASMSGLMTKRSDINLRTTVPSSQYLVKDIVSSRSVENEVVVSYEKGVQYDFCEENKCRDRIEELQHKNEELEEELSKLKAEHAAAASNWERCVREARAECVRERSRRARAARAADLRCDELSVALAIERGKVSELETSLRAAEQSGRLASAIQTHLAHVHAVNTVVAPEQEAPVLGPAPAADQLLQASPQYRPKAAVRTKLPHSPTTALEDSFKNSDDSGYTESNRSQDVGDTKAPAINQALLEKIADLQNQVDNLKAFKDDCSKPQDVQVIQEAKVRSAGIYKTSKAAEKTEDSIISESSESVVTEKQASSKTAEQSESQNKSDSGDMNRASDRNNRLIDMNKNDITSSSKLDNKKTDKGKSKESVKTISIVSSKSHVLNTRKLSLQSLRENLKERNLAKTGSLDENRINEEEINRNGKEINRPIGKSSTDFNKTIKNNNVTVLNEKVTFEIKEDKRFGHDTTDKNVSDHLNEGNFNNSDDNVIEEDNKTDSDSSQGTYSIHRDDNALIQPTKVKAENIRGTKVTKKDRTETVHKKHLNTPAGLPDVKNVVNASKNRRFHRKSSAPDDSRTYVKARPDSPYSTDCEISSLSDLPSERDVGDASSRSVGEERPDSEPSRDTTADCGSLSEGELPARRHAHPTVLSAGEVRPAHALAATFRSHSLPSCPSLSVAEAMAEAERELARCSSLLRGCAPAH